MTFGICGVYQKGKTNGEVKQCDILSYRMNQQYSPSNQLYSMVSSLQVIENLDFMELQICYKQKIKSLELTTYRHGTTEWE
jgi:hypothetical protein